MSESTPLLGLIDGLQEAGRAGLGSRDSSERKGLIREAKAYLGIGITADVGESLEYSTVGLILSAQDGAEACLGIGVQRCRTEGATREPVWKLATVHQVQFTPLLLVSK